MPKLNYTLWGRLLLKLFLAGFISAIFYLMTIEVYSIQTTVAGAIDYNQIKIQAQLYEHWSLFAKALYHFNQLEIHNLFKHSNSVIKSIYIVMYLIFLLHIYTILIEGDMDYKYSRKITLFTKDSLLTLGTIGTMYSMAMAMKGRNAETSNISDLIQVAFFDAIYTTIMGLTLFVIAIGISIFNKRSTI